MDAILVREGSVLQYPYKMAIDKCWYWPLPQKHPKFRVPDPVPDLCVNFLKSRRCETAATNVCPAGRFVVWVWEVYTVLNSHLLGIVRSFTATQVPYPCILRWYKSLYYLLHCKNYPKTENSPPQLHVCNQITTGLVAFAAKTCTKCLAKRKWIDILTGSSTRRGGRGQAKKMSFRINAT